MKRPPRFAIASAPDAGGIARVSQSEAHHMRDVARLNPGDRVSLIAENGASYEGTISKYDHAGAEVLVTATERVEPKRSLILASAIIKGPRMDTLVEKAAELGATELWPIVSARSVGKSPGAERIARWRRIATAASKQSLALPPMQIADVQSFAAMLKRNQPGTTALICTAGAEAMHAILEKTQSAGLLIAIGPEGDFAPEELDAAISAGFIPAGLGPNRLRSETAALAAIAIAQQSLSGRTQFPLSFRKGG